MSYCSCGPDDDCSGVHNLSAFWGRNVNSWKGENVCLFVSSIGDVGNSTHPLRMHLYVVSSEIFSFFLQTWLIM